jgi:hypothetical protein
LKVPCVGEFIEIDDRCRFRGDPVENEVGANKSGAAGDEDGVFHRKKEKEKEKVKVKEKVKSGKVKK